MVNFGFFGDIIDDIEDAAKEAAEDAAKVIAEAVAKAAKNAAEAAIKAAEDAAAAVAKAAEDVADAIADGVTSAAGDILRWAKNEAETVGAIVQDEATGTLHLRAKIGGTVYHAVLDTTHAVVGAVQWVFDKIATEVGNLVRFIETLIHWDDIRRTKDVMHNVMHNVIKLWFQNQVDNIPRARQALDETVAAVEKKVNECASITNWSSGLGDVAKKPASGSSGSNPSNGQTSDTRLLADKYRDHANQLQILGDSPAIDIVKELIANLVTAISSKGQVLGAVFTQLQDLVNQFASLTVEEILIRVMAILADGTLSSM